MQKKIIALAVAALASSAAFAQTNVTIYGIADVGMAYSWGGGHQDQIDVVSGGLSGSRIGFKGVEDLGNGLKALFTLEYGVDLDRNYGIGDAQTTAKARTQMVGLTGGFGTLVAGRLQTAGYDFACATSPIAGSALDANAKLNFAAPSLLSCGGNGRADNAVAYITPTFAGVTGAINHARLSETAGTPGIETDAYANLLSVGYNNFGLNAQVLYAKVNGTDAALGVDRTEWGVRGSYDLKVATVFGSWQNFEVEGGKTDQRWSAAVAVPFGKHTVVGQYAGNDINSANKANSSAYTLAYTYGLSKRSTVYAGYTYVSNETNAAKTAGFNGNKGGEDSQVVAVGLRHAF